MKEIVTRPFTALWQRLVGYHARDIEEHDPKVQRLRQQEQESIESARRIDAWATRDFADTLTVPPAWRQGRGRT